MIIVLSMVKESFMNLSRILIVLLFSFLLFGFGLSGCGGSSSSNSAGTDMAMDTDMDPAMDGAGDTDATQTPAPETAAACDVDRNITDGRAMMCSVLTLSTTTPPS